MKRLAASLLLVTAIFIGSTIARLGGQQPQTGAGAVYTAAQAQAGQAAYAQQCAGCHGNDFRGSGDAPAVVGPDFRAKWGPRATNELFTYLVQTMPPTNPGALGEEGTLNVTAYLLQINGAPAGQQPLTPRVETPLIRIDDRTGARCRGRPRVEAAEVVVQAVAVRRHRWCWALERPRVVEVTTQIEA